MRRREEQIILSTEHRAAASRGGIHLHLAMDGATAALAIDAEASPPAPQSRATPLSTQIRQALAASESPLTLIDLRRACRVRTSTICDALASLAAAGHVSKSGRGYKLNG